VNARSAAKTPTKARVTEVSVRRLRNLGNYESMAVELTAVLNKGARPATVLRELEDMARAHLGQESIEREEARETMAESQERWRRLSAVHQQIEKIAGNVAGHLRNARLAADNNDDKCWRSFVSSAISSRSAALREIDNLRGAMAEWRAEEARAEVQRARVFLGLAQPALPEEPLIPEIPPELVPEGWDRSHH
jgi:hypothetical protein